MKLQTLLKTTLLIWMGVACCFSLQAQLSFSDDCHPKINRDEDARARLNVLQEYERVRPYFEEAYQMYPSVPKGALEAVAYSYTRYSCLPMDTLETDASAMPKMYGVLGLTLNGKGVFRENLRLVSDLSGVDVMDLVVDNRLSVLAYAAAFARLQEYYGCFGDKMEKYRPIFVALSELPLGVPLDQEGQFAYVQADFKNSMTLYPLYSSLYEIYCFLADTSNAEIGTPGYAIDFAELFGGNLDLLRKNGLSMDVSCSGKSGNGLDYPAAIWCPAASCNYAAGRSLTPSNVVIHYTSGTYAGSIAWFQNCQSSVSSHYVIRSFDGQVTQMVSEADRAWHVGNENGYTIGIEHEAYGNVASWFTEAMYQSSANLVRNICARRPIISTKRTFCHDTLDDGTVLNAGIHNLGGTGACTQIRGHQHYPGQSHTDPGPYWNWNYYYKQLNPNDEIRAVTGLSGSFTDSGGDFGNYADNERQLTLIHVPGADSVVLEFSAFDLETDYDFMWIYAGDNVFAPLLGRWNTHSPNRVVASGEYMMVEFRSDCTTTHQGWTAEWYGVFENNTQTDEQNDDTGPATTISWNEEDWVTRDFTVTFSDNGDSLQNRFFQVMEKDNNVWTSNPNCGFLCDNFDYSIDSQIWTNDGHWQVSDGALCQPNSTLDNAMIFARHNGNAAETFLYDFYVKFASSGKCSFLFHANGTNSQTGNLCAYEMVLDNDEHSLCLYKILNGTRSLLKKQQQIYYLSGQSQLYRVVWDRVRKSIKVFRHASLLAAICDVGALPTNAPQYVGFATYGSAVSIDNVRCYISRTASQLITVGEDATKMIRKQAQNETPTCKLKSIVLNGSNVFSPLVEKSVKVDYTPPTAPIVMDGLNADIDVATDVNMVSAHWTASVDENSGISGYSYYLTEDMNDAQGRINWLQTANQQYFYRPLPFDIPCVLRVGVMARNNAGLCSDVAYSDGIRYGKPLVLRVAPNPSKVGTSIKLRIVSEEQNVADGVCNIRIVDMTGRMVKSTVGKNGEEFSVEGLSAGIYVVQVLRDGCLPVFEKLIVE